MHAVASRPHHQLSFRREPRPNQRHTSLRTPLATGGEVVAWFVLNVMTGRETAVTDELLDLGYAAFCPMERTKRLKPVTQRRKGETHYRVVDRALLPSYTFVGLGPDDTLSSALRCEHMIGALGSRVTVPVAIPASAVMRLAEECAAGRYDATLLEAEKLRDLIGKTVTLPRDHALAGLDAKITDANRKGVEAEVFLFGATRTVRMSVQDAKAGGA